MKTQDSVVAVFKLHDDAENAVKALQHAGFDMKKLSIIARDYHTEEHVIGYYNVGDRMKFWGKQGAFWGAAWGLLFGSAFFIVPGIGPIVVAGPLVAMIVAALENAVVVGGLSMIGAGLCSLGIPKDSLILYERDLAAGKFVLLAHGAASEIAQAQEIVQGANPERVILHKS